MMVKAKVKAGVYRSKTEKHSSWGSLVYVYDRGVSGRVYYSVWPSGNSVNVMDEKRFLEHYQEETEQVRQAELRQRVEDAEKWVREASEELSEARKKLEASNRG